MTEGRFAKARWRRLLRASRRRRTWRGTSRIHVEVTPEPGRASALQARIEALPGVRWARYNAYLGSVIVELAPHADPEATSEAVEAVSRDVGRAESSPLRQHPELHPGDIRPLVRTATELGAELSSVAAAALLRFTPIRPLRTEIDLAALLEVISDLPLARKPLERVLGIANTEVVLEVASSVVNALLQKEMGPAMGTVHRALRGYELWMRRKTWPEWEERLCSDPDAQVAERPRASERPRPRPPGPIERYMERAGPSSLSAFGLGVLFTRNVELAASTIFAGVPRAARYGRDAFASYLGARLAHAGVLVLEPHVLRHLDAVDTLIIDGALAAHGIDVVIDHARAAELRVVATAGPFALSMRGPLEVMPGKSVDIIRELQRDGHCVSFIALGANPGLAAADVAIAVDAGNPPPWGAHLVCADRPAELAALVDAVAAARRASEHAVKLSMAEAMLAAVMLYAEGRNGTSERTTEHIMAAASAATLLAMLDGVRLAHRVAWPEPTVERHDPPWHSMSAAEVLDQLRTQHAGLTEDEAQRRLVPAEPPPSATAHFLRMLGHELASPMAPVLLGGVGLSIAAGAYVDAAMVAAVVTANSLYGGLQRFRASRTIERLSRREATAVRVRRFGRTREIPSECLVEGDVIELAAGDVVPADCRILAADGLEVDEAGLTGESLPVAKSAQASSSLAIAERSSMLYADSALAAGTAVAVVTAVGANTEAGRAAHLAAPSQREGGVEERLSSLTSLTAPLAAAAGAVLAGSGLLRGRRYRDVLSAGVSLTVAAVPEGLPVLATLAQLAAASRLSEHGVLVRNPRAIETLGRVDVVCADKTGTLTEGRIHLRSVSDGRDILDAAALDDAHRNVLAAALRATPSSTSGERITHLTDRALIEGARSAGVTSHSALAGWKRVTSLPFEPRRGYHASLARHDGGFLVSAKGAPEVVLERCDTWRRAEGERALDDELRTELREHAKTLARGGFRVLAVAEKIATNHEGIADLDVGAMTLLGFVALADPVRDTARSAVAELQRAGVRVLMVTGDHPSTAAAIAEELDLGNGSAVVTGPEIDAMDDAALAAVLDKATMIARVTPIQKVRIVRALQQGGHTVAMTGDGANDAPAIRLADVGIALGEKSTAAARQAADIIVTDERIETIVHAALEGRALWTSVRDAVALLVGGNIGEIAFTLLGGLIAGESPLNARQLLLVNIITDTLPSLAIALRPPRQKSPEELIDEGPDASLGDALIRDLTWRAVVTTTSTTAGWLASRFTGGGRGSQTVALLTLTSTQLVQTLIAGRHSPAVIATSLAAMATTVGVVQIPGLSQAFGCRPLGPLGLAQAAAATAGGAALSVMGPAAARIARTWQERSNARRRPPPRAASTPPPTAERAHDAN